MSEEQTKVPAPAPSVLDMLVDALALRIKDKIMEEIDARIADSQKSIDVGSIEGLDSYVDNSIYEYMSDNKIDADDIEGLEKVIERTIYHATFSIEVEV